MNFTYAVLVKKDLSWHQKARKSTNLDLIQYKFKEIDYTLSCNIFLDARKSNLINKNIMLIIFDNTTALDSVMLAKILNIDCDNRTISIMVTDKDIDFSFIDQDFINVCKQYYKNEDYLVNYSYWINGFNEHKNKDFVIDQRINKLNKELFSLRSDALHEYKKIVDSICNQSIEDYLSSWHGTISRLKNDFLKLNTKKYESFDGLIRAYYQYFMLKLNQNIDSLKTYKILKSDILLEYIKIFLERDFYRHIFALTREKVGEDLTEIYFGKNYYENDQHNIKALYIKTRQYRMNIKEDLHWESHYHQMKNASYNYYSIGHLLTEGIVYHDKLLKFKNIEEFYQMPSLVETADEKKFLNCYLNYIKKFEDKFKIPLLIPQFRFDKDKEMHKYRLDFLIMNFSKYPAQKIGIELSRSQTHISEHDRKKRNEFFERYNITILEFTEGELSDIQCLFDEKIIPYLIIEEE